MRSVLVSWGGLFVSAAMGLLSLAGGLWLTNLVEDLFAHSALLGTVGLVLAGAALVAALAMLAKEIAAIARQNRIAKLHIALAEARLGDDIKSAREHVKELCKLYEDRPETAARALWCSNSRTRSSTADLVDLAERP